MQMKPIKLKNASHHLRHKQLSGLKSECSRSQWERVLNPVPSLPSTFVSKLTLLGTNSLSNPAYLVWFTVRIRTLTDPGIFFFYQRWHSNYPGTAEAVAPIPVAQNRPLLDSHAGVPSAPKWDTAMPGVGLGETSGASFWEALLF